MLLEGKKIIIMGVRNKWSIAWGAAQSAYENGAEIIFTYGTMENKEKIEKLISEIPGAKGYACDASNDESIKDCLENIKKDYGNVDGILHCIAHANTEDLRNDFIKTSRDGFAHACDVSAYSLIAVSNIAKEKQMLNPKASIVTLTYFGAEKTIEGYNVMGVAKAALQSSIRYLAKDLGKYSKEELRYIRNLPYALRGYSFKDEKLQAYYKNKYKWYKPEKYVEISDMVFTDDENLLIEKINKISESK